MAKRFKLRICRVIATTLQSCRSKDPSNLPKDPVPSFSHLSKFSAVNFSQPRAVNHHIPSAFISIGCALPADDDTNHPPQFKWQKEDKWHVVAKIHQPRDKTHNSTASCDDSDADDLVFAQPAPPTPPPPEKNRRRAKKKRNIPSRLRLSTSSADSGWFSSEGGGSTAAAAADEETETLVSSSPGSSAELHPIRETQAFTTTNVPHRRSRRSRSSSKSTKRGVVRPPLPAAEGETPATVVGLNPQRGCVR